MRIVAFAGPSLPNADRGSYGHIEWRPPAEAGDLLRLLGDLPDTICLIDGWFDHRPAVRHKEILALLSEGVRIFGASSIGALRAAEMHSLGMVGVGAIFRGYADGRLVGDDEVALVHAPAEWDWRPVSIPLVDVRATLHHAVRRGAIAAAEARSLMAGARAIHYVDRGWGEIVAGAGLPCPRAELLVRWLSAHAVRQKRLDARACIELASAPATKVPARPPMVRTVFLDALAMECAVPLDRLHPTPAASAREAIPAALPSGRDCAK